MNARRSIISAAVLLAWTSAPHVSLLAQQASSPRWEPFRNAVRPAAVTSPADPATAAESHAQPVRTALAPPDQAVIFPQPVFESPPCEEAYSMAPPGTSYFDLQASAASPSNPALWQWRTLPSGVIWQSYWAGARESRISGAVFHDENSNADFIDVSLGGRASLLRYGSEGPGRPEGVELQIEGAGFPRLNLNENWDLDAVDFRFGAPIVYGRDQWQAKFGYYHLSSHLGDEYAIRELALAERINYSRDALVLGFSYFPLPAWRWYAEAEWAFHYDESEPWAFQFGVDVAQPGPTGPVGTPFVAVNGHIREELDYGGNVVFQAGWLWRGDSAQALRLGLHYLNGKSNQFEFFDEFEQQIGGGLWYDF